MSYVTIGPKSYRSKLPIGKVEKAVAEQIALADSGQLRTQIFNFNLRLGPVSKDGLASYVRAFVVNGACRFKRYGVLDLIKYKVGRLFVKS